ncbi:MAG: hypothetical protein FWB94_06690 [Chitinispirillia bacterium]|nr:hypothetical protein [Chitinispirillia bacterium]
MRYIKMALLGCVCIASLTFGQARPQAQPQTVQPAAQSAQPQAQHPVQPGAEPLMVHPAPAQSDDHPAPSLQIEPVDTADAAKAGAFEGADAEKVAAPVSEAVADESAAVQDETVAAADGPTAAAPGQRTRTRLGVLWLRSATGHDKLASDLTRTLIDRLDSLGLYEMYYPEDIEKALKDARVRVPANCSDPQCVHDIGKALGMRRMVYGSVDMTGSRYAVSLNMFNVATGRVTETASIEGAPGVPAADVLFSAVDRIHGKSVTGEHITDYYGPPVNNITEFLWTTVAVQGAGIFYALVNYGVGGSERANDVEYSGYNKNETLSGISASSNQVPLFARPAALANAYTAVSDDAYGVLYNPAGMAWVTRREAVVAYQYRFGMDLLAVSYANRALRDLGFGQAVMLATDRDGAMTEMYYVTAAGYKINQNYLFGPVSVGASLKFMGNTVRALSLDSPFGQSYGVGLDIGAMWELSRDIRYGVLVRDFPAVNKWKNRTTGERYTEYQPPTLHMGGSYRAGYSAFLTADGQIPLYADQPWVMAGGIEYEFFRMLALRIGLQREILDDESAWWKITGGAGFRFDTASRWGKDTSLDFAYEYNTLYHFTVVNVSLMVGF